MRLLRVIFLFAVIISTQYYYDLHKKSDAAVSLVIIPAKIIKLADFGLHSAASSIMWLYTVQEVAGSPKKIPEMIRIVNELDPEFSYPYAFAALALPSIGFPEEGIEIAEEGITKAGQDWRIPYYLATAYHTLGKRDKAAFYFDFASKIETAPHNIQVVSSQYGTKGTVREQTKLIWQSIYENSDDEMIKERAKNYLVHIEMVELLEEAVNIYRKRYRDYPQKIDELVSGKILKEIPQSPLGVKFRIENGRIFSD